MQEWNIASFGNTWEGSANTTVNATAMGRFAHIFNAGNCSWKERQSCTHPDFSPRKMTVDLWLENWDKPCWMESQLLISEDGVKKPLMSVCTSTHGQESFGRLAAHGDHRELGVCRKLCEDGRITDAVDALDLLVQRGCYVPNNIFYRVLKGCIARKDLALGRRIHALTLESGYEGDAFLATHLIGLYSSHGRLEDAMRIFTTVSTPDVYNWANIIFAHARHGEAAQAIQLYRQMCQSAVQPDNRIYLAVLKACATVGDLVAGKEVHAHILASPEKPDMFLQTALVDMYAKCNKVEEARRLFDSLPEKNVVAWNAMFAGYAQHSMGLDAISLYRGMQQEGRCPPDSVTFVCLLQACTSVGEAALPQAKELHAQIEQRGLQHDVVLGGSLVNMYAKCGSLEDARNVFDGLPNKNVAIWNAIFAGYSERRLGQEVLEIYTCMQLEGKTAPNSFTFVYLLQACASVGTLSLGKQLHAQIKKRDLQADVVVGTCLIDMYSKCGSPNDARIVFDGLANRDVVTWNAMLACYAEHGLGLEALTLYGSMQLEGVGANCVTFVSLLQACASLGVSPRAQHEGKQLHAQIEELGLQNDVVLGGSLVNMYAKCGSCEDARKVFDSLTERNMVTWNAMLAGYVQQGMGEEALELYSSMLQLATMSPDSFTFVCLLQACAISAALPLGRQLHAQIEKRGLQADVAVGAALVNMYSKCGSMSDAQQAFDVLPLKRIEAWGALIGGYTSQGDSAAVFELFDKMRLAGMKPDGITLINVLTVCSHVGLVDKGRKYFEAMTKDYNVIPTVEHYTCMMDLLGRAGHLTEALEMAKSMPFPSTGAVWRTLLGACQKWDNVEIGLQAFEHAVSLDERDAASYVLMSNIYASAQMGEAANQIMARRIKSEAWKKQGHSWCPDVGGLVHTFAVGDKSAVGKGGQAG